MWRSVLLMLLVGAMVFAQEIPEDRVYPVEGDADVIGVTPEPATPVILQSAVNYWKMEEAGTDDRVDSISTDDLTPNEAITVTPGKNGDAANFDLGTHALTSTAWRLSSAGVTVSAWLKRDALPSQNAWFLTENTDANPGVIGYITTTGGALFLVRNQVPTQTFAFDATDVGSDSEWVHFCGSWNSGDNVRLFIDGAAFAVSGATLSGTVFDQSVGLRFGSAPDLGNPYSGGGEGYVDEVAIWETGIGLTGCSDIYDAGEGKFWP